MILNKIISGVVWKFAERTLAQLVSLVISIVLARLLLPDDFGVISMVTVFITFTDVLITSGFPVALIQKKDADETDYSSVFFANVALSVILYIVLFFLSPFVAEFYNMPILSSVLRILGLRVIISSVNSVQYAFVSKNMMFKKYFWAAFLGTTISGIVGIVMAYMDLGVWALVAQQLISTSVGVVVMFVFVKWRPKIFFSWRRLKELFRFGWKILFEGISETFTVQVRNLIIGKVYTSGDLGYYTKAQQFPNLLVSNVVSSVSSVLFPAMSAEQDNHQRVKELMRKSVKLTSYVMFPLSLGLALVAKPLIEVVLTDKWLECAPYLQIFCFTQVATVGMICRHEALKSIGRSDVYMYEHFISRIAVLAVLFAVYKISVMAIALSLIVGSVITSVTVGITSKKYNGYRFREQLFDILPLLLASLIMGVPVYLIGLLSLPAIVVLALQVLVGAIVYLLVSHIFKLEGYMYLLSLLKNIIGSRKGKERV